jgi:hypothetical protein
MQGFLSGLNLGESAATNRSPAFLPNPATIEAHLDTYCRDNPMESPMMGALILFREVQARQRAGASQPGT